MLEYDLFGNIITYFVVCLLCEKSCEVLERPPTKQLSFHVCEKCRQDGAEQLRLF